MIELNINRIDITERDNIINVTVQCNVYNPVDRVLIDVNVTRQLK